MATFDASANAAMHLEGRVLEGGWTVGALNIRQPEATGGMFSVSYPVIADTGNFGFMKVIDLAGVMGDIDKMQTAVNEYVAERDLLMMCAERRLSRVVVAIGHGSMQLPEFPTPVHYIIFELAPGGDVRRALAQEAGVDVVLKLDMLHSLATGIRQLHQRGVAHQDVKPSNLLVFKGDERGRGRGKVGDLGRAYRDGAPTAHDSYTIPGDKTYAPPEQLYRHVYPDVAQRRYAADLYQIGSLACFLFTGSTMNSLLYLKLAPEHRWGAFGDAYDTVLEYVREAFAQVIDDIRKSLPNEVPSGIVDVIKYLCEPDAHRRGHPAARRGIGDPYALERIVSELDLLARRAALSIPTT